MPLLFPFVLVILANYRNMAVLAEKAIFVLGIPPTGTKLKESGGFSSAFDSLPSILSSHFLIEVLAADYLLICHETGSSNPTEIPIQL